MKQTPIQKFIHIFRIQQVKSQLHKGLCQLAIGSILLLLFLGILESIFYFSLPVRATLTELFIFLFISFLFYILLRALLHSKSIFNNSNNLSLAKRFIERDSTINDRLLNALQLEESLDTLETGRDLAKNAIKTTSKKPSMTKEKIKHIYKFISMMPISLNRNKNIILLYLSRINRYPINFLIKLNR